MEEPAQTLTLGLCPGCGRTNPPDSRFCAGCGQPLGEGAGQGPAPAADPLVDRVLADRYRILSLIGRGGMGVVYKAEHVHIGKLMAIKLLHGELSRNKDVLKRFRREAEAASRLSHPNTVQIFDFGRSEGLTYLVMEFVDGEDLGTLVKRGGGIDFARAARLLAQVCASVEEAHEQGIVHRDVKPENIMVTQSRGDPDFVKVLDFGLAKLREGSEVGAVTVTRAGHIVGTPYYMAPEQIRGERVDPRTDVYAIGAVLYRALTGTPPYWAPSPVGVLTKHLTDPLVPPSERTAEPLPPAADAIVSRAMEKDPADRYPSAAALRDDLLEYLRSTGEDTGPAFLGASGVTSFGSADAHRRPAIEVATRGDVDAFERGIRRRGRVGYALLALLVVALGAAGFWVWRNRPAVDDAPTVESEPNDEPVEADLLARSVAMKGYLGKRMSEERSDADVYRIETPDGERRVISIEVTPIPNMDLVVEIAKAGRATPLLEADSGGVGEAERVPNFPIHGTTHYLRVREQWLAGEMPTENVSDAYSVRWEEVELAPQDEREINDSLELANDIELGGRRRGLIGWAGDVDHYCLPPDTAPTEVVLSGVAELDLVLRATERGASKSTEIDRGGPGEGERWSPRDGAGSFCFEVSADQGEGRAAAARERYVLEARGGAR